MSVNGERVEVPRNGIQGLKHWRYDIVAGLLVSIVSLPLSLGIAVASGAPPITGLTSAIIAGLIVPFIGGTYVTVSGPAAGLAPALLTGMIALGEGDRTKGYPLLLAVIMIVGAIQIIMSLLKAAQISAIFPSVVVEGMLASIGLLIIAKQIPYLMGSKFQAHTFFEYVTEIPDGLNRANASVLFLGMASLATMFILASSRIAFVRKVPPQLIVVVLGVIAGRILGLEGEYLIHLPDNVLEHGITVPHFSGLFASSHLYHVAIVTIVTLALIDGVESLATAAAIDRIDPFHRKSDPNRTLFAMGVCNIASSLAGGLTIIPGGVKSKACIVAGGRTLWSNMYNAIFLVLYLSLFKSTINMIPYTILASILIYTGYRMCEPKIWRHLARIGPDQSFLFVATIVVTLATDLLVGIAVGTLLKLCVALYFDSKMERDGQGNGVPVKTSISHLPSRIMAMFRNPVVSSETHGSTYDLHFGGPVVCFNSFALGKAIESIPAGASHIRLYIDQNVSVIDHTSFEILHQFKNEIERLGDSKVEFVGLDRMRSLSSHESSFRLGYRFPTVSND
jgi:MFS superfamily sulfate permease-like transporter